MAARNLADELSQQALNLVELHNGNVSQAAKAAGMHPETLRSRFIKARLKGLKPTVSYEAPRIHRRQRLGRMHLVIPDVQARMDVPFDHLRWIGNYIVEKKPDVIVQIGDFADVTSFSKHNEGKMAAEGQRYRKDMAAVHRAMDTLLKPIQDYNRTATDKYQPEMHLTLGNHEYRIIREVEENPKYEGKFGYDDLRYEDYGWKVHDFLKVIEIDGIEYAHYFTTGVYGRPVSSAAAMLRERQKSCTMGHVQYTDMAIHKKTQNVALFCGICYLHDEAYLGPQGNNTRRQIVVKHEVENGRYDPMLVSLRFLEKNYQ